MADPGFPSAVVNLHSKNLDAYSLLSVQFSSFPVKFGQIIRSHPSLGLALSPGNPGSATAEEAPTPGGR